MPKRRSATNTFASNSPSHKRSKSEWSKILTDRIRKHQLMKEIDAACRNIRSMFNHPEDHKQFISILLHIEKNEFIKSLNVPSVICSLIAEYSTGQVHWCSISDPKCKNSIQFLHQDHDKLIRDDSFRYNWRKKEYYCGECKDEHTSICDDCHISQELHETSWCSYPNCVNFICPSFEMQCSNAVDAVKCRACDELYCGRCIAPFNNASGLCQFCHADDADEDDEYTFEDASGEYVQDEEEETLI